jgi:hypothetical protein
MIKIKITNSQEKCPSPTQDVELNLKNRQKAIKEQHYGPPDPNQENEKFWKAKQEMWEVDDTDEVKSMLCGNCAAFDMTKNMLNCIAKGLDEKSDPWSTIQAGKLGYCKMLKFKCASKRTCDAWIEGGPIKD